MRAIPKEQLNVAILYKNFKQFNNVSHIGLGICALNNAKVLQHMGIRAKAYPVANLTEIDDLLKSQFYTHIIIQALWVPAAKMAALAFMYPDTQFACVCHSNVGFLQAEPRAITLFKEYLDVERETVNFHAAGNSHRFCRAVEEAFTEPVTYLPNMYWLHHKHGEPKPLWRNIGGTLRIGIFGASRVQKNLLSGVMASIEIASNMGAHTEVYISSGRDDGGAMGPSQKIRQGAKNLVAGLPNIKVIENPWATWPVFIKKVGSMNLLMQPSYSESFNIVTADGCAEGVPSVVSSAITWAPENWVADVDDAADIARVGTQLLNDPMAAIHGFNALRRHNKQSQQAWLDYLVDNMFGLNPGWGQI